MDTTSLLDCTGVPEEFLQDPSYWMRAQEMEKFLQAVQDLHVGSGENILQKIGHATPDLRAWGVFDSVLRMMSLQDVFAQPSRFLSYFISPEPPVDNLVRTEHSISFDLPVPSDQYPLTVSYLQAAFESLPVFSGRQLGQCRWRGISLHIEWDSKQHNIFNEADPGHQISPDLMRSIVAQLEKHQLELQQKNAELEARNEQLRKAYHELEADLRGRSGLQQSMDSSIHSYEVMPDSSLQVLRTQLARLGDYMVRAQQLITLLVGTQKVQPGIKQAMKRVDWEWVKQEFPVTMGACFEILQKTVAQNAHKSTTQNAHKSTTQNAHKSANQDPHQDPHQKMTASVAPVADLSILVLPPQSTRDHHQSPPLS